MERGIKMETKVSYEQIEKANQEIKQMDIKGNSYAKVSERLKAYRKVYPCGSIETNIEEINNDSVRMVAIVKDEQGKVIATGRASEQKEQSGNMKINLNSMIENCETSAVGRALGFAGFGIDKDIASQEEMVRKAKGKFEFAPKMYISEYEAKAIVIPTIKDLARKLGIVLEELKKVVKEQLWCDINDLNIYQLLRLETEIKALNYKEHKWHFLYNQNSRTKNVVGENMQVNYKSSQEKFAEMALANAGTDVAQRELIIEYFYDFGIDLTNNEGHS